MTSYNSAQHGPSNPDRDEASLIDFQERETGRSNFTAFVLGGVVVTGGLLGFLYYDTDNLSRRDGLTTSTIGAIEQSAQPIVLKAPNDSNRTGAATP